MENFLNAIKTRRSIYAIGGGSPVDDAALRRLVQEAVQYTYPRSSLPKRRKSSRALRQGTAPCCFSMTIRSRGRLRHSMPNTAITSLYGPSRQTGCCSLRFGLCWN